MTRLFACVASALAFAVSTGACLPPDRAIERGAVYIELGATAKTVQVSGFEIKFDRIVMIAGADLIDCHSVFYVEHPPPPTAIFDVLTPYVFEHRSITETACVAAGGFIVNDSSPLVVPGTPPEEVRLLQPRGEGTGRSGCVHIVADLDYLGYQRHFDLTVFGMANAKTTTAQIPRGDKVDVRVAFDTQKVGAALLTLAGWDVNADGNVTSNELPAQVADDFKNQVTDSWVLQPPRGSDAGR